MDETLYTLLQLNESGEKLGLIIFDVDGTLADRASGQLLSGRREFFLRLFAECPLDSRPQVVLASNQGGVGFRHWMKATRPAWFEEMSKAEQQERLDTYPGEDRAVARLSEVATAIATLTQQWPAMYISFAYQFKSGGWADPPADVESDLRWSHDWRKPLPGMLRQAMTDTGVLPHHTLMVGDRDEDAEAAKAAGCNFTWTDEFFTENDAEDVATNKYSE